MSENALEGKGQLYLTQGLSLIADISYRLRRVQSGLSRHHDWRVEALNFDRTFRDLRAPGTPIRAEVTLELEDGRTVQMDVETNFSPLPSQWRWQILSGLD